MYFDNVPDAIGHTPILGLGAGSSRGVEVYAKLELQDLFGMKGRVARNIIPEAKELGILANGAPIVESSSGTMALGIALGGSPGYPVQVVTDLRGDPVILTKLRAMGCEVHAAQTMTGQGRQGAQPELVDQLMAKLPRAFRPDQYGSPDNPGSYRIGSVPFDHRGRPTRRRSGLDNDWLLRNLDRRLVDEVHRLDDHEAFVGTCDLARQKHVFAGHNSSAWSRADRSCPKSPRQVVLLIETSATGADVLVLRAARELGQTPVLATGDAKWYTRLADLRCDVIVCDTNSPPALRSFICKHFRRDELVAITTASVFYVAVAAPLATWLGSPGNSVEGALNCGESARITTAPDRRDSSATSAVSAVLGAAAHSPAPFDQAPVGSTWLDALTAAWLVTDHTQNTSLHEAAVLMLGRAVATDPDGSLIEPRPLQGCPVRHAQGERAPLEPLAERERSGDALAGLWLCLTQLSFVEHWVGRLCEEQAYSDEADTIHETIRLADPWRFPGMERHTLQSHGDELRDAANDLDGMAEPTISGLSQASCRLALTVYAVSRSRYEDACRLGRPIYDEDMLVFGNHVLPELVEAATRAGDRQLAGAVLHRLEARASACGTDWAMGLLSRSQALVMSGREAEQRHRAAIKLLDSARIPLDQARAHLLYGEWLRRQKRRADAVAQLRVAHEMFTSMGTRGFADRARTELRAAGARIGRHVPDSTRELTPQEEHAAQLAGRGLTNREIAVRMFISENTVAYHLKKIFRKLGVSSRRELVRRQLQMRPT